MTEFLINERQEKENKNIDWETDGFLFAQSVNDAMLANMSAWVHYSLKRYYGCMGDGQYGTANNQLTKRGYVLSQYAKYVSGTTRVRHALDDATSRLSSSAYLSTTGDSVVVMVINPTADTYTTTLTLPFYTLGGMSVTTSATENAAKTAITLSEETYTPEVAVQPYSVNTYIMKKSSLRSDIPEEPAGTTTVFTDNYALYGSSCVPTGWRAQYDGGMRYAGNYSLGPRIMGFSAEGAMKYAFYFRAGSNANGYVSYGEETTNRLYLEPGKYTLTYTLEGWKAMPRIACTVQTATGSVVKSLSSTPSAYVSESGSSVRIINATDCTLDFSIASAANYVLRWTTPKVSSGYGEALVGNIRLVRNPDATGIEELSADEENAVKGIFTISGQRISKPQRGVNIINGRKVVIR